MEVTVKVTSIGQKRLIETMAARLTAKARYKPQKWSGMTVNDLFDRLAGQCNKLSNATPEDAWKKAADVANFAAMVADNKTKQRVR